ncbi:hypothetical protein C8F04DRAFT_904008, partial [Mycena alexandri]
TPFIIEFSLVYDSILFGKIRSRNDPERQNSLFFAATVYPSQICGSVPLYGLYQSVATIHFYTINETTYDAMLAVTGGWADQGIAGYV